MMLFINKFKIYTVVIPVLVFWVPLTGASDEKQGWSGKGEAGISLVSGNSDSQIVTAGFDVNKKSGHWDHSAKLSVIKSEATLDLEDSMGNVVSSEQDTADSLLAGWITKYLIGDRSYVFLDLRYLDDKFDSFEEVKTYSLGYGYKIFNQDETKWDVSAGLGYKDTEYDERITDAELVSDNLERDIAESTFVLASNFVHKLTSTTEFSNETRIEGADANTYAQNIAALSVSMTNALALKIKYDVRHNTDPAPGDTSTDKITSVNIVYNF